MSEASPKQAILVVNAMSRRGEEAFEQACELIEGAGIELIERHAVDDPNDLRPTIEQAIQKAPMVIVGGGDGTISSFAGSFKNKDTVLAVLPLGTANSFARTLGFPIELEEAAQAITDGKVEKIDLGCIDGHWFANVAALGLSPLIAETIPDKLKKYLSFLGYILWAAYMAFRFHPFRLTVDIDGQRETHWSTEVRIANGRFHGGVELVEDADIEDGRITVQAITGKSLWHLAWSWFTTVFHLRARERTWREWEAPELKLETQPPKKISVDGEIRASTPCEVKVMRHAIRVVVPA
ncbi:YegS/Rv2252/BmrU family lipid kinase [Sphingomicrobium clamense]|uniref:YegS/Rv2252/BmrU family lipid kinase n=1 Tax=Sphingomicrobium clamense TaxID=2851013 RepID=A0ABS6V7L6_9SPHN|nr:YegS/Rv2252/BmrU family lipid kinase [Sphingomicrobium sp. B8]MBW0145549.1 YegS/Rv2252/BmrU family lipid kinase [Sphingomicrobium sp. B8]